MGIRFENNSLFRHEVEPPLHNPLLQFEIGNAVGQQSADAIGSFKYGHRVTRSIQLSRTGEARWTRADDSYLLTRSDFGRLRTHPALPEGMRNQAELDLLDGDWIVVDAQDARGFAGSRTNPTCKLREIVGLMKNLNGFSPTTLVNQVIPIRNDVPERTAGVTEGDATIHAAGTLRLHQFVGRITVHLKPIANTLVHGPARRHLALDF